MEPSRTTMLQSGRGSKSRLTTFLARVTIVSVAALVKTVLVVLFLLPLLLAWLWRWIQEKLKGGFRDQDKEQKDCRIPFPEDLMRRPDPCIYSQSFLTAQGVPVTWNNPDIWVARKATPNVIEPDSYHLLEKTDYIVFVQTHNASVDLALGVRVRLVYRPWSFNSPDVTPVEVDANGHEVFRIVNIPPMGSAITTFAWRTPSVGPDSSHFCLQAILSHPLDINPGNNLGQENTQVYDTDGKAARIVVPLHNPAKAAQRFTINATQYRIEEKETVELRVKYNRGRRPADPFDRVARLVPAVDANAAASPETAFVLPGLRWSKPRTLVKAKYVGVEPLRDRLRKQDVSLPPGLGFQIDDYDGGVRLDAGEVRLMNITLVPPPSAPDGQQYGINLVASDQDGRPVGGVTVLLTIAAKKPAAKRAAPKQKAAAKKPVAAAAAPKPMAPKPAAPAAPQPASRPMVQPATSTPPQPAR